MSEFVTGVTPTSGTSMSAGSTGSKSVTGGTGTGAGGATADPVEVKQGWAYIVRPPRFPIVKTPRQRGGVRAGEVGVTDVHVVVHVDDTTDRIFFLSARASSGAGVACKLEIEGSPLEGCNPPKAGLLEGWYTERSIGPFASTWSGLKVKQISDLPAGDPLRMQLQAIIDAGPGGGGGGGGGAGGAS